MILNKRFNKSLLLQMSSKKITGTYNSTYKIIIILFYVSLFYFTEWRKYAEIRIAFQ